MWNLILSNQDYVDVSPVISSIGKTFSHIGHDDLTKGEWYIHSSGHVDLDSGEWPSVIHSPILVLLISPMENDTFNHGAMVIFLVVNGRAEVFLLFVMLILKLVKNTWDALTFSTPRWIHLFFIGNVWVVYNSFLMLNM
jgi:hypothetical protein